MEGEGPHESISLLITLLLHVAAQHGLYFGMARAFERATHTKWESPPELPDDPDRPPPKYSVFDSQKLRRLYGADAEVDGAGMNSEESVMTQYFVNHVFRDRVRYVASNWHAGVGPLAHGTSGLQHADLVLAIDGGGEGTDLPTRREIKIYNHHGSIWHSKFDFNHAAGCVNQPSEERLADMERLENEAGDGSFYSKKRKRLERRRWFRDWLREGQRDELEDSEPVAGPSGGDEQVTEWEEEDDELDPAKDFDDLDDDVLKRDLAAALSEVAPDLVVFSYETTDDCTLFCSRTVPNAARWNPYLDPSEESRIASRFSSVRSLLQELYPQDVVLGPNEGEEPMYTTQADFIDRIMNAGNCADGSPMGGFISLRFGKEEAHDLDHEQQFGFCTQKTTLDAASQLGGWTRHQASMGEGVSYEDGLKTLQQLVNKETTLLSNGFSAASETLDLDYFRYDRSLQNRSGSSA